MNKCDEFAKLMVDAGIEVEKRSYLELACALEDKTKELEAKDKEIKKWQKEALQQYPTPEAYQAVCNANNNKAKLITEQNIKLEANKREIAELRNAPIDGEFPELDAVCEKFNKGEFDLASLVCRVWNTSIGVNSKG